MNSTSKKRKVSENNGDQDRLSELSDDLLLRILSFLPTKDAVRTVAIRRFGELWTLLPSLEFNIPECFRKKMEYFPHSANFVRNVLFLHKKVPVNRLKLRLGHIDESFVIEVTTWIRFAVDRQTKEFSLSLGCETNGSILLRRVFTSQFLVVLKLHSCRLLELREVQMRSLRKLSLFVVETSQEVFEKIILGSPFLQELDMQHVTGLTELRFTAPNIKKLDILMFARSLDCPNLKTLNLYSRFSHLQFVDISSIHEVYLDYYCDGHSFGRFLKMFCNVEVFKFSDRCLALAGLKVRDLPQTRWTHLHIDSYLYGDQCLGICNLLRSSPHLEELVVSFDIQLLSGRRQDANLLPRELPSCLMKHLKTITMRGHKVSSHVLLQLAELLLKNSVTLEEMVILPSKSKYAAADEVMFLKQLVSFPRASTNARVLFGSEIC